MNQRRQVIVGKSTSKDLSPEGAASGDNFVFVCKNHWVLFLHYHYSTSNLVCQAKRKIFEKEKEREMLPVLRVCRKSPKTGWREVPRCEETARRLGFVPADRAVDEADGVFSTD